MTVGLLERKAEGQDYPGLRAVWARLMQRSHKTGIFYYPTTFDLGYGTAEERQRFAIWMLFSMACDLAQRPHPFMLRRDLESHVQNYRSRPRQCVRPCSWEFAHRIPLETTLRLTRSSWRPRKPRPC